MWIKSRCFPSCGRRDVVQKRSNRDASKKFIPVGCYAIDPLSNDELMFSFYAALQCLFSDAMFIS